MAMTAERLRQTYEAGVSSCLRVIYSAHDRPMDLREIILRQQATEIFRYMRDGGLDLHDTVDRLDNAREALGIAADTGQIIFAQARQVADMPAAPPLAPSSPQPSGRAPSDIVLTRMSDIEMRSVDWLWPDRVALGKVTALAGYGGLGKSTILFDIAAAVSRAAAWPAGEGFAPFGSTIILSSEDDPEDTIAPRLAAAQADLSKIYFIRMVRDEKGERSFNLQNDLASLEARIAEIGDVKLVIIDPVTAYLGKIDSHKNAEVRGVLGPLCDMTARARVATICNTHFAKGDNKSANAKIIGSVAFVNQVRMAIVVLEDAHNPGRMLFIPSKTNISRLKEGLAFRIEQRLVGPQQDILTTRIVWEDATVAITADEMVSTLARKRRTEFGQGRGRGISGARACRWSAAGDGYPGEGARGGDFLQVATRRETRAWHQAAKERLRSRLDLAVACEGVPRQSRRCPCLREGHLRDGGILASDLSAGVASYAELWELWRWAVAQTPCGLVRLGEREPLVPAGENCHCCTRGNLRARASLASTKSVDSVS